MRHIPKIGSVMSPFPFSVEADEQLGRSKALMEEHDVRHLPVKQRGKLFGVITHRDIERAQLMSVGLRTGALSVGDVCERNVYSVPFDAPLDDVLDELANRRIGCVLVQHNGNLAGIFTTMDACAHFRDFLRARRDSTPDDGVA